MTVALLAEGVDRNRTCQQPKGLLAWSPSSRRAWIEIGLQEVSSYVYQASPSSRRAWIEMVM
mgnify:CR=1 FL=1